MTLEHWSLSGYINAGRLDWLADEALGDRSSGRCTDQ
jgi:hypothetical protein